MCLHLFQAGALVVGQKSVADVESVEELEGVGHRWQGIARDNRNDTKWNLLIDESLHVSCYGLGTQAAAHVDALRAIGIKGDADAVKESSFSEKRKHVPVEGGKIGLNGIGYGNLGSKNQDLRTVNFPKEAGFEKKRLAAVPDKFDELDIVLDHVRENVEKHFLDLAEIHSLSFMKVFEFVTIAAS